MTIKSHLYAGSATIRGLSPVERAMGRPMRSPDDHGGTPAPSPAPAPAPAPAPSPAPSPAPAPAPTPAPTPTPAPAPTGDRWQDKFLREDIRGDASLALFDDQSALGDAYINLQRFARDRLPLPKDGDAASYEEFAAKLRPADAADYKIAIPEGQSPEIGEAMRGIFHKWGAHPTMVEGVVGDWNQLQSDLASKGMQAAKDEVTAIELELGPTAFEQRRQAAENMLKAIIGAEGDTDDLMGPLEQAFGAGKAMKIVFALAERTGELGKVDPTVVQRHLGGMTPQAAEARLTERQADAAWREKVLVPGSAEANERKALIDAMKKAVG